MTAKKIQTSRMSYGTCRTRHFLWVRNSLILLHKTNIKSFLKERWTNGHLFSSYKEKIWVQFQYTCLTNIFILYKYWFRFFFLVKKCLYLFTLLNTYCKLNVMFCSECINAICKKKILWIEANYKHYFSKEITFFTITFLFYLFCIL